MTKLYCLGEMLIDFIPISTSEYVRHFGGAPANVALGVSRLGGDSQFIGQVGNDAFGQFLIDTLKQSNVDVSTVKTSKDKNTPLAMISLSEDGERSFSFYRDNTADLAYDPAHIDAITFDLQPMLHFCSVSLVPSQVKDAHDRAIKRIKDEKGFISFDPNLRFNLWSSEALLKDTVLAYIPGVDLLKVSEEELTFLTGETDEQTAIDQLKHHVNVILVSKGSKGCTVYTPTSIINHQGFKVKAIDTTGAGDAFIAATLKQIQDKGILIDRYTDADWLEIITYANAAGALTATQRGATDAIPNHARVIDFIKTH